MDFFVLLADVLRQILGVELGFSVQDFITVLFRAGNFLKHAHLVDHVVLQAGVTEGMFALGDLGELLDVVLAFADPAQECLHDLLLEHLPDFRHIHRWFFP